MGPSVLLSHLLPTGCPPWKQNRKLQALIDKASKNAHGIPPFRRDTAEKHLLGYKEWAANVLCAEVGLCSDTWGCAAKHLCRTHAIVQTYGLNESKRDSAEEVSQGLAVLTSKAWLPLNTTFKKLMELVPDPGGYVQKLPGCLRPWQMSSKCHNIDPLMLSYWSGLAHDCLAHAARLGVSMDAVLDYVNTHIPELHESVREHAQRVDSGVPMAPRIYNLLAAPLKALATKPLANISAESMESSVGLATRTRLTGKRPRLTRKQNDGRAS